MWKSIRRISAVLLIGAGGLLIVVGLASVGMIAYAFLFGNGDGFSGRLGALLIMGLGMLLLVAGIELVE